jgi:monoamine oxidase
MRAIRLLNLRYGPLSKLSSAELRLTRRDALRASLAAGAGLLLSGRGGWAQAGSSAKRVVVVGAGFSGLSCAHELTAAGYDVTVLEARPQVGGRVLTFTDLVPGRPVEGGGELIGSNHPAWVGYAEQFGLTFRDVSDDDEFHAPIQLGGRLLSEDEAAAAWEGLEEGLNRINAAAEPIDADRPWLSPGAAELDAQSIQSAWLDRLEIDAGAKGAIAAQLAGDNGVRNDRASWLCLLSAVKGGGLEAYWSESEVYRCAEGNQALATRLAEPLGRRLVLELAVRKIDASKTPIVVTCSDGRTIECDDVVLSVPPSVWKRIEITPALPATLAPQMGVNTKFLTRVRGRFWKEQGQAQYALGDGLFSWTWESTDQLELAEGEAAGLTAFSGGPSAEAARAVPRADRERVFHAAMEALQPGFTEHFEASRFMDWPGDPWTQAGYSFPAPGQVTTQGPVLREGLRHLHFCGEHTSYAFIGYMEGALSSGAGLAKRLALRDGLLQER